MSVNTEVQLFDEVVQLYTVIPSDNIITVQFTTDTVRKTLRQIWPIKLPSPGDISLKVLKKLAEKLASTRSKNFESSTESGTLPADWKLANISLILKGERGPNYNAVRHELFSKKSPTRVYEDALKICANDQRVQDLLGSTITGCGEANRRGRRTHVASSNWSDKEGRQHMAMRFFLKGNVASGTVHLEVYENDKKDFEYRYLVVEVDGLVKRQVILRPETTTTNEN